MLLDKPLLSVLLPAYNVGAYIQEAIESILNQTYQNFELLICDDASTDQTLSIIDTYDDVRIRRFHNKINRGKTNTINILFAEAHGEYVTIHDGDDVSASNRFYKQIETFKNDPDLALCGTSFVTIDKNGYILEQIQMSSFYEDIKTNIYHASQFHGPTMMIRKTVLDELGEIYRPYFKDNYEDTDLALRIIERYKGYNLKEALYVYRILETSLCRKEVDVRNRNLYKIVSFLGMQRQNTGSDYLMQGMGDKVDKYFDSITTMYQKDPSLIYREASSYYFYWHLNRKALATALKGLQLCPSRVVNLRLILYLLRKSIPKQIRFEFSKKHYKTLVC